MCKEKYRPISLLPAISKLFEWLREQSFLMLGNGAEEFLPG